MTDHYEMPHARADECPHAGVGKACRPCRDRFERAPITLDERAAMRERYTASRGAVQRGVAALTDVPRLLDALDTAEAEVARLREDAEVLRGWITEHEETIVEMSDALDEAARPAPVWDEEVAWREAVRLYPTEHVGYALPVPNGCQCDECYRREAQRDAYVAGRLAVVLEHLPVFAADIDGLASEIFEHSHEPALPDDENGMTEARSRAIHYFQTYVEQGGSRSEVEASALHDAARAAVSDNDDCIPWDNDHDRATVATWLDARADRLAAEGGDDRGR